MAITNPVPERTESLEQFAPLHHIRSGTSADGAGHSHARYLPRLSHVLQGRHVGTGVNQLFLKLCDVVLGERVVRDGKVVHQH